VATDTRARRSSSPNAWPPADRPPQCRSLEHAALESMRGCHDPRERACCQRQQRRLPWWSSTPARRPTPTRTATVGATPPVHRGTNPRRANSSSTECRSPLSGASHRSTRAREPIACHPTTLSQPESMRKSARARKMRHAIDRMSRRHRAARWVIQLPRERESTTKRESCCSPTCEADTR